MKKGKFIVFEGLDGSGKTVQAKNVSRWLFNMGIENIYTNEPTNSEIGVLIRKFLSDHSISKHALALLFAADRIEHAKYISDCIDRGIYVLCDRYIYSSLAYQSVDIDIKQIYEYNQEAMKIAMPDLIVFLDTPVEICLERIAIRNFQIDIYENEKYLSDVLNNYNSSFNNNSILLRINGNDNVDSITKRIGKEIILLDKKEVKTVAENIYKHIKI